MFNNEIINISYFRSIYKIKGHKAYLLYTFKIQFIQGISNSH